MQMGRSFDTRGGQYADVLGPLCALLLTVVGLLCILLCLFLLSNVCCFTVCVLLSYIF